LVEAARSFAPVDNCQLPVNSKLPDLRCVHGIFTVLALHANCFCHYNPLKLCHGAFVGYVAVSRCDTNNNEKADVIYFTDGHAGMGFSLYGSV
jgi:hypothetical protein